MKAHLDRKLEMKTSSSRAMALRAVCQPQPAVPLSARVPQASWHQHRRFDLSTHIAIRSMKVVGSTLHRGLCANNSRPQHCKFRPHTSCSPLSAALLRPASGHTPDACLHFERSVLLLAGMA